MGGQLLWEDERRDREQFPVWEDRADRRIEHPSRNLFCGRMGGSDVPQCAFVFATISATMS